MTQQDQAPFGAALQKRLDGWQNRLEIHLMPLRPAGKGDAEHAVIWLARLHRLGSVLQRCRVSKVATDINWARRQLCCMRRKSGCRHRQDVRAIHHREVLWRFGQEVRFHPGIKRLHVAIGLVGRDGKQRIVDIVKDRQSKPTRLVPEHFGHRHGLQTILNQVGGLRQKSGRAWQILIMGVLTRNTLRSPKCSELFNTVFAALWQVQIADQCDRTATNVVGWRIDVKRSAPRQLAPDTLQVPIVRQVLRRCLVLERCVRRSCPTHGRIGLYLGQGDFRPILSHTRHKSTHQRNSQNLPEKPDHSVHIFAGLQAKIHQLVWALIRDIIDCKAADQRQLACAGGRFRLAS